MCGRRLALAINDVGICDRLLAGVSVGPVFSKGGTFCTHLALENQRSNH